MNFDSNVLKKSNIKQIREKNTFENSNEYPKALSLILLNCKFQVYSVLEIIDLTSALE
jgi:hypothetical protein